MSCERKGTMGREKAIRRMTGLSAAVVALLVHGGAFAQSAPAADASAPAAAQPSPDAMTNLIRLLVAQGTITRENGDKLLAQAQAEAATARAAQVSAPPPPPAVAEGAVRVTHVPDVVRKQIKDELRQEVMAQAATEGWATKDQAAPEWTRRIRVFGDVRIRSESDLFSRQNSNQILDLAAMNAAGPIDLTKLSSYQFLNTTRDRINRMKFRARLGVEADVVRNVTATVSIGSGDDNSPISQNSMLGGGLAQRPVWIDLANIKARPWKGTLFEAGRFENPFNSTTLLYDEDLRFDGVVGQLNFADLAGGPPVTLTGGAFPLDYGSNNYPDVAANKRKYPSKWLFSGELKYKGAVYDNVELTASAGIHIFHDVQGKLSDPCNLDIANVCSTDGYAPQFLRKGNTLFTMRDHLTNSTGVYPQVYGLKFKFDVLDLNLAVKVPLSDGIYTRLWGNYVQNLGFSRHDICNGLYDTSAAYLVEPYNNYGSDGNSARHICTTSNPTSFIGGNKGWLANLELGSRVANKRGSWKFSAEYRYLQTDAVLDAYTDSDFHMGGTNAKGTILMGEYNFADRMSIGARWYSADQIVGDPFSLDVLLVDLKAKF